MRSKFLPLLATVVAIGACATAARADGPDLADEIRREARDLERRVVGLWRVRYGYPQRVSGGVSALFAMQPAAFDCSEVCKYRGPIVQFEPGTGGAQLGLGYAVVFGERRPGAPFLHRPYLGYGLKGTVLRSWGDSPFEPEERTLVGVEADFTVIGVSFSLGLSRRTDGGAQGDEWIVDGGLGWGF